MTDIKQESREQEIDTMENTQHEDDMDIGIKIDAVFSLAQNSDLQMEKKEGIDSFLYAKYFGCCFLHFLFLGHLKTSGDLLRSTFVRRRPSCVNNLHIYLLL